MRTSKMKLLVICDEWKKGMPLNSRRTDAPDGFAVKCMSVSRQLSLYVVYSMWGLKHVT